MKRLLALALLVLAAPAYAQSLGGLSTAPSASAISGTNTFPVSQGSDTLDKATATQIATFVLSQTTGDCTFSTFAITCTKLNGVSPGAFFSGTDAANLTGTLAAARLPASGATAGSYADATHVPQITVDATGRITAVSNVAIGVGGSGTVTTSGTPATGNLAKFSGSTVVTNGDLSGDCTTSGTLAVTCTKTSGSAFVASATTDTTNAANISSGTLAAARLPATTLATGTSVTLTVPRQYYVCTGTCTVTPPVPAAGYEFCVLNGDNVATVITLAALGSSARYENTGRTAYGTAGTGTLVSGGAVADKVCIVGLDSTHYLTTAYNGTWTAN